MNTTATNQLGKWVWLIAAIPLFGLTILAFYLATRSHHFDDKPLMVLELLAAISLVFILLDLIRFGISRIGASPGAADRESGYQPHLQIWGLGLIVGAATAIFYLQGTVTLALLRPIPDNGFALFQNLAILACLVLSLGIVVWAIVRICQTL
ncbi:MAG: hypothetical protein DKINENOH_01717 [bacterium]|nr:hypothetical protein [bacterium]